MAGKIPAGTFNTRFNLDGDQSVKTLRQLKTEVNALTSGWKAQEAQLKSSGDALGAAKAKYEGLSASVKHQEDYISKLRSEQSKLDTSTNKGSEDFAKMEKQIAAATVKLESMSSQQSRAKSSMDYYKSGVAEAQKELTRISETSKSYVTRLQAEGKTTQAAKAEVSGLGSQYSKMETIYKAQVTELNKIATASGKSSEAYAKQSVRVNETATKMAQAKTRMGELNATIAKANPSIFSRINASLEKTNKEASKTPGLFKKIVAGGLITNAVSNGFTTLTSSIKGTLKSGLELNEAGEVLTDTWKNMGKSANDVQILNSQMSYLRAQTGATGIQVNKLQTQVDTFTHGNTERTTVISAGIAGIATASRIGGDGMVALGKSLNRVIATGDLTTSSLARLEKQAPTMGEQLAKAAGVSQTAFATMVDKGKVSGATFQNLLYKIGTTSSDTFKDYGKTAEGAMSQIRGGWTSLKAKMTAPLLDVKNSGMSSLSSLITSPILQAAATKLGQSIATVAGYAQKGLEYINKHKKDVTGIASDLGDIAKIAGETVWKTFKTIISDVGNVFGVSSKNAKNFSDPLGTVHSILDKIVKNKSAIQTTTKALLAMFAIKKATDFAGALGAVVTQIGKLGGKTLGTSLSSGLSNALSGNSMGGALASAKGAGGVSQMTTAGKAVSGAVGVGIAFDAGTSIYKAFTDKKATAKYKDAGKAVGTVLGGGIGMWFGGPLGAALGSQIGKVLGGFGGKAAKQFMSGWGAQKKPANSWLGSLGWDAKKVLTPVTSGVKSLLKTLKPITTQVGKLFTNLWTLVSTATSLAWKRIKPIVQTLGSFIQLTFRSISKVVGPLWNALWKTAGVVLSNAWKLIKSILSNGLKVINDVLKVGVNLLRGNWSGAWNAIKKTLSDVWNGIRSVVSTGIRAVYNVVKSVLGSIGSVWRGLWSGMKTFFSGIWSGIKSAAKSGLNGVIDIINGAIGGINWVWQKFTGHNAIKKIQKLAQGGIVGKMQTVMVNDGAGPDYKELYKTPQGQYGMLQQRNAITMLPIGTRVYNGKETKGIMQMAGIQHYAGGGIVGAVGNFFKAGWDKVTAIGDWLKHPVKNMEKAISSAISGMTSTTSMFTDLGKGVVSKMVSGVSTWAQKQLKKLEDTLSPAEPKGTGVQRWKSLVKKALAANGLSTSASMIARVLRQINTESGGNPKAKQAGADPDGDGSGPAIGLMQTKASTFAANAFAGHKNIYNGYDNILAGLHYAKARYGSSLSFLGNGHGYANGGFASSASIFGEDGLEAAIPLSSLKSSRGYEMLGKTAAAMAARDSLGGTGNSSDVGAKLDKLITLMTALATDGINETVEAHFHAYLDKKEMAKEMVEPLQLEMGKQNRLRARQKGVRTW